MQLIFENWRGFLNERESDVIYKKLVDFWYNEVMQFKNFDNQKVSPGSTAWHAEYNPFDAAVDPRWVETAIGKSDNNFEHDAFLYSMKPDAVDGLYDKWREVVPQEQDVVFSMQSAKDVDHRRSRHRQQVPEAIFRRALMQFRIYILYDHPNDPRCCGGDMSSDGRMRLYHVFHQSLIDYAPGHAELRSFLPKYHKGGADGLSPQKAFEKYKERGREVLDHELTHYINAIRAKGEWRRAAGGRKQHAKGHDVDTQEYVDSTEEIQARLIEAFMAFDRMKVYDEDNWWQKAKDVIGLAANKKEKLYFLLKDKDVRGFIKRFINDFYKPFDPLRDRFALEKHNEKNQQRIINRVYEFAKDVLKSEEYRTWLRWEGQQTEEL